MTRITFFKEGNNFYGFEENGHTGFGSEGDDILCAAISSMTMLIINTIIESYHSDLDYIIDDKTTDIKLIAKTALPKFEPDSKKQFAISGLIYGYYLQLMDIEEEYYKYLKVSVKEVPYDCK